MLHQSASCISDSLHPKDILLFCLREPNDGSTKDDSDNLVQGVVAQLT